MNTQTQSQVEQMPITDAYVLARLVAAVEKISLALQVQNELLEKQIEELSQIRTYLS
jgi:hypothetical protein